MCFLLNMRVLVASIPLRSHRNREWRSYAPFLHGNKRHEAGTAHNGKDGGHQKTCVASSTAIVPPRIARTEGVVASQVYIVVGTAAAAADATAETIVAVVGVPQACEVATHTRRVAGVAIGRRGRSRRFRRRTVLLSGWPWIMTGPSFGKGVEKIVFFVVLLSWCQVRLGRIIAAAVEAKEVRRAQIFQPLLAHLDLGGFLGQELFVLHVLRPNLYKLATWKQQS